MGLGKNGCLQTYICLGCKYIYVFYANIYAPNIISEHFEIANIFMFRFQNFNDCKHNCNCLQTYSKVSFFCVYVLPRFCWGTNNYSNYTFLCEFTLMYLIIFFLFISFHFHIKKQTLYNNNFILNLFVFIIIKKI